ncbi:MAG: nicotinate (nicotinamide) nucleotide adenylyltransferase [Treponema sp.]|nr:nicotinate (nicotinamide) nucleotide adenylyltransferase [Treponema sp.]
MKIALLGGTFNPLHIGHCMLADTVVKELGYDKVLFVPTYIPPHKVLNTKVSPEERLSMVKSFCDSAETDGKRIFEAEACEIERQGVSYTIDTLRYVIDSYKLDSRPAFIMGQEVASQFDKWNNSKGVAEIADLIIARRHPDNNGVDVKGFSNTPSGAYLEDYKDQSLLDNFPYKYTLLENPIFPVSSTEIRSRIANGKSFRYLVPDAVFQYICENNLYGIKK